MTTLKELGFKLIPYDPCIANLEVNGNQLTIAWYVDDTKISHVDPRVVTWLLGEIEKKYGKLITKRGKTHTFVGMDIEFLSKNVSTTLKMMLKGLLQLRLIKDCLK